MSECERIEIELSAIADGEGDPAAWSEVLDHVVSCSSCREFHRQVRGLDALAGAAARAGAVEPPAEVWEKVEQELRQPVVRPFVSRPAVRWAVRAAAAVLVTAGLWSVGVVRVPAALVVRDGMEVTVGSDSGRMTDAEFVEVAVSVLQADRRYRDKMLEILSTVQGSPRPEEGAVGAAQDRQADVDTWARRGEGRRLGQFY